MHVPEPAKIAAGVGVGQSRHAESEVEEERHESPRSTKRGRLNQVATLSLRYFGTLLQEAIFTACASSPLQP